MKIKTKQYISVQDWDDLVQTTYGRYYKFQQQDGCKDRGTFHLTIPNKPLDYENDSVPDKINGDKMGVSFAAWLERNPKDWYGLPSKESDFGLQLFWGRNFYPDVQMVANDLHAKGLIDAGEYIIDIDW